MKEIWKPVLNYEGYYEVSNIGRVRSVDRAVNCGIKNNNSAIKKGKILKCNLKRSGYYSVDLCKLGTKKTKSVHRLVAEAFIAKENPLFNVVNHKNSITTDNRICNLEWTNHKGNSVHAKEKNRLYCGHRKSIICVELNKVFDSSYKASEWLNSTKYLNSKNIDSMSKNIRACCCGTKKSAYGYKWKNYSIESSTTSL